MLYELILINEIEQRAKIIFLSVDALCKCRFIISETIVNRAWKVDMFHRS